MSESREAKPNPRSSASCFERHSLPFAHTSTVMLSTMLLRGHKALIKGQSVALSILDVSASKTARWINTFLYKVSQLLVFCFGHGKPMNLTRFLATGFTSLRPVSSLKYGADMAILEGLHAV